MQRVSRSDYDEWRHSFITEQLFNFFKLEAEFHKNGLMHMDTETTDYDLGAKYKERAWAVRCYEMLGTIEFEDLFPEEEKYEESESS